MNYNVDKKTERIYIKVTEKRKEEIQKLAQKNDMSMSAFIEKRIDGYNPIIVNDRNDLISVMTKIRNDMAKMGNLMKMEDDWIADKLRKLVKMDGDIPKLVKIVVKQRADQDERRKEYMKKLAELKTLVEEIKGIIENGRSEDKSK